MNLGLQATSSLKIKTTKKVNSNYFQIPNPFKNMVPTVKSKLFSDSCSCFGNCCTISRYVHVLAHRCSKYNDIAPIRQSYEPKKMSWLVQPFENAGFTYSTKLF